jgi:uncharacterized protein (DUF362 family)
MGRLDGLGLDFDETMSGWVGIGETDFAEGLAKGEQAGTALGVDLKISIADLDQFLNISHHTANLTGTVTFEPLGGTFTIRDGVFNLFTVDPTENIRHMTYSFRFTAADGRTYYLNGHKKIKDDPGLDMIPDMTTLFTKIYAGKDEAADLYAAGRIRFKMRNLPSLLISMTVTGNPTFLQKIEAKTAFASFAYGVLADEYLRFINPFYDTKYENLVLSGTMKLASGESTGFFLVSGVHDKDFPWGDGEIFSDVLLAIGDGENGYKRYCITDRTLSGQYLDVEHGTYRYKGPIFELTSGYAASFSEMRNKDPRLEECEAEFEITFVATPYDTTPLPFTKASDLIKKLSSQMKSFLEDLLPSEQILGVYITPHTVKIKNGGLKLTKSGVETAFTIIPEKTFGEAERSTISNIKEPTLLYGYICSVRPEAQTARVQIHAGSLRNERQHWLKDQLDAFLGAIVSQVIHVEMLMEKGHLVTSDLQSGQETDAPGSPPFVQQGEPVIEVNNDHYPTAVFQRRIIAGKDPSGETCLALEEAMDIMRRDAINSGKKVTVAAIKDESKLLALQSVLEQTKFWDILQEKCANKRKSPADLSIVIKPNFMFAYNWQDFTTYTDPELVEHLVELLRERGFTNIFVVEAQSTYGEYFDKRSVREMAEYLKFQVGSGKYTLVDLTQDPYEERHLGPKLGYHRIPVTWRDADVRISFAKNKTHAYAYYTLTLKNIYGALPLANKFKEYHCDRDIYETTIEYLTAFPVDYGLVDAYVSADGPFGIFADGEPNVTQTIIGGADLVAVDWVAATKMGLDPMVSSYMRFAVAAFGKPEIELIGDPRVYHPWLNVPTILTLFAHYGLDANFYFGNLFYMCGAYMDTSHFDFKDKGAFVKAARAILNPLQTALFLQAGGEQSRMNKALARFLTWLGDQPDEYSPPKE